MREPPIWSLYRHPRLYQLAMKLLYRQGAAERFAPLLRLTGDASIVELFAGEGQLADFHRGPYLGFERSGTLVRRARARGRAVEQADVRHLQFPSADYYLLVDGLYQLLTAQGGPEDCRALLQRAQAAARKGVLLVEPVENLQLPSLLQRLSAQVVNAGDGPIPQRFTEAQLRQLVPAARVERWGRDLFLEVPPSRSPDHLAQGGARPPAVGPTG